MKLLDEIKLDFDDVLIVPQLQQEGVKIDSRSDADLIVNYKFPVSGRRWSGIPIICSNMACVGTFAMAEKLERYQMVTCLSKYLPESGIIEFLNKHDPAYTWVTAGFSDEEINKLERISKGVKDFNICIDVPNGYLTSFGAYCKEIRDIFPNSIIMAGNVATASGAEFLLKNGVDLIKAQVGPGSACKTRMVTGVGYGTISCIIECSKVAPICSDGGCRMVGDINKGIACGASFMMLGGLFAGTDECDGEWIMQGELIHDGDKAPYVTGKLVKKSLKFYGMSTHLAQEKHVGVKKDYRASEGVVLEVPYRGPVENIVAEILGGMRSAILLMGIDNVSKMHEYAEISKVNKIHSNNFHNYNIIGA